MMHQTRAALTPEYPRLPRSIYVQHVETVKQSGPLNSLGMWEHAKDGDCEQYGQAQNGVNLDFQVKFDLEGLQNNRGLKQGLLHLWSKFSDASLNGSRVIARTS